MDHQEVSADPDNEVLNTGGYDRPKKEEGLIRQNIRVLAWSIFVTGVLYYCFAYLLRVYPSVMELQLRGYFHITAGGFGLLTAFYYFAYAPMQLPVGVSVDRIGPRRALIFASLMSTLGAFIFAHFKW